jgi:hypothetical protein
MNKVILVRVRRAALTLLLGGLVFLAPGLANAASSVTLAWNTSSSTNVTGYNLHYGTASQSYNKTIDVGNATNTTISGLIDGTTYFFAATAYNAAGTESDFSNEATYTAPLPTNAPPTLAAINNVTVNEDSGPQNVNLAGISSGSTNESQTLTVTATSSNPGLIPNPSVTYTSPNSTGTLTFTPALNASGSATISVTVNDGQPANNTVTRTFTVTVNAANDPPTLNALNNLTVNEDAGAQTVNLSGISSGASNEVQTLTITATSGNTALIPNPAVTYSSPNTTGSLSFTPVANAFGTATITVTVNDGQALNNTTTRTFTVTVNAVNDPPTLGAIGNITVSANAGAQTVNLQGITTGAANENDTLSVTATSSNPALIANPSVSYTSPNATGSLSFTPAANASGSATITVTVNDGQPANNTATRTFTVTVSPAGNQPPTLNALNDLTLNEDASAQSVNLSGITSGATNENQTLTVTASSSNPGLTPSLSLVYTSPNTTGTLLFTPAANANGTAVISVTVNDGQAVNNTITRSFTLTVNAVNDPPTLSPIPNMTIAANSGAQTVNLQGITTGAANENDTLSVTATSSNPALIANPSVSYASPNATGSLSFTPTANASGSATITVTVNDGQPANNTATRAFLVTVTPAVNTPPTISQIPDQTTIQDTNTAPIPFTVGDSETAASNLTVSASSSNPTLLPVGNIVFGGSGSNRTVTLDPATGEFGTAAVTVSVSDGVAASSVTFQFTVIAAKPVNTPPVISAIPNQVTHQGAINLTIPFTVGDKESAASSLGLTAGSSNPALVPASNIVFGGSDSNRTVTLTPVSGQTGSVSITLTVSDGLASASNSFQVIVTPGVQVTLTENGGGTISPNIAAGLLTVGNSYSVTAFADAGQRFVGWTGSIVSSNQTLTFVAATDLNLVANFVAITSFTPINGTYGGLFYEADEVSQSSSGSLTVQTTSRGTYSGKLQIASSRYSFSGRVNAQGQATNMISRHNASTLALELNFGSSVQADQVSGRVTDGNWVARLSADRATYNATTNPAPYAGNYTMLLPGRLGDPTIPSGDGFGTIAVSAGGLVTFAGTLGDGTKISQGGMLTKPNLWPFYTSPYSGKGSLMSWLAFHKPAENNMNVNGLVNWIKLGDPTSSSYPAGFTNQCQAIGSIYVAPITTSSHVLKLDNAGLVFSGGSLSEPSTNFLALGLSSRVTNLSSNKMTMTFSLSKGTFRGTLTDPITGKAKPFSGVVMQNLNAGYGTLLGGAHSSRVELFYREGSILFPPADDFRD